MNRRTHLTLGIALGLGLTLALIAVLGSQRAAAHAAGIRYVAPGGACGGATPCYATVQSAVDAALPGDEIRIAAGTYTDMPTRHGLKQTVYVDKSVTLRGGYSAGDWDAPHPAANPTMMDAQGQGRVLYIIGDITPTIEGLHITGGDATGLGGYYGTDAGGAVYVISATAVLRDNAIYGNRSGASGHGGALFLRNSGSRLYANHVYSNTAGQFGGGLYMADGTPELISNTIAENSAADYGGGLYLEWSQATLQANTIVSNTALQGGGGYLYYGSEAVLQGNTLRSNSANHGGGLSLFRSRTALSGNIITGNSGAVEGGGMWLYQSDATLNGDIISGNASHLGSGLYVMDCSPRLSNVVIMDNQGLWPESAGSGIYARHAFPHVVHTTIARNSGGDGSGVHLADDDYGNPSSATFTNTIISGHTLGMTVGEGSTASLTATLWYANHTDRDGAGSVIHSNDLTGDPVFTADGYHITAHSAARDQGVNAGVAADIDGQIRPQGSGYDLGADEFASYAVHLPIVLNLGQVAGQPTGGTT